MAITANDIARLNDDIALATQALDRLVMNARMIATDEDVPLANRLADKAMSARATLGETVPKLRELAKRVQ